MDFRRYQEAARWIVALDQPLMAQDLRTAYEIWCRDPANAAALAEVQRTWTELNALRHQGNHTSVPSDLGRRALLVRSAKVAAILGGASLGGGSLYYLLDHNAETTEEDHIAETSIGEQRSIPLTDGSIINLNVVTRLRYRITPLVRKFYLETGQAEFIAATNPGCPFIVHVRRRGLRTSGGVFDVKNRSGLAELAVSNGEVTLSNAEIEEDAPWSGDSVVLHSGETISYAGSRLMPVRTVAAQSIGEWRNGVLTFKDIPLRDVVRELNLYFPTHMILQGDQIGQQIVTLRLKLVDQDRTVDTVADLLSLNVVRRNGEIVFSRKGSSSAL